MSKGYKEQCLADGAVAMYSFDGDQFERTTFTMLGDHIIDEVDDTNPATIETESSGTSAFLIGSPSMVYLEQANQYSARFGGVATGSPWPRSYMQIPHSNAFTFPNEGSFSVEFMIRKDSEQVYGLWSGAQYWMKLSPVMRKIGVFTMWILQGYGANKFGVNGPIGTSEVDFSTVNMVGINTHIVFTWSCQKTGAYEYKTQQRLYANNRLFGSIDRTFSDGSRPDTGVTSNWEVGGFSALQGGVYTTLSDRNTSKLCLDQISIYDRALTHSEVANHFQKTNTYRNCILLEGPTNMWGCDDLSSTTAATIAASVGGHDGTLYGSYLKSQPGPALIPSSNAVELGLNGMLWVITMQGGNFTWPTNITISGDYTFEFWFRSAAGKPASLLNFHGITPDFDGWQVDINTEDGETNLGAIQFTERRNVSCIAYGNFNDDQWHHLGVRRSGSTLDLFLDGNLESRTTAGLGAINAPGQLIFFAGPTARQYAGPGAICYIATYNYALAAAQISCRSLYSVGYEIKGMVTLMGNPISATLRFYLSKTGELLRTIDSDGSTGLYRCVLDSNAEVDILVFDKYDKNVRYRAYGPVSPAGFEDFPISI